jgi:hypothetical protein
MRHRALLMMMAALFWWTSALFAGEPSNQHNTRPHLVSLIRLIANPNDFNGQPIKVVGYLGRGGGLDRSVGLFVSEIDGRNFIVPNSIDLHVDESTVKDLMRKYVAVSGTYHAPDPRADYNGYIDQIVEIKPLKTEDDLK